MTWFPSWKLCVHWVCAIWCLILTFWHVKQVYFCSWMTYLAYKTRHIFLVCVTLLNCVTIICASLFVARWRVQTSSLYCMITFNKGKRNWKNTFKEKHWFISQYSRVVHRILNNKGVKRISTKTHGFIFTDAPKPKVEAAGFLLTGLNKELYFFLKKTKHKIENNKLLQCGNYAF